MAPFFSNRARKNAQKGQATVVMGMMLLTFLLFFAFAINTGMMVNARINLQNAADMAAYAGAATQARQLTQISLLNYQLRQHYKQFLFRYYVLGNFSQSAFPKDPAGPGGEYDFRPNPTVDPGYGVPAVCLSFSQGSNPCQVAKLPSVAAGKLNGPTSYASEIYNDFIQQMANIQQGKCRATGELNRKLLLAWLFNSNPQGSSPPANPQGTPPSPEEQKIALALQGLTRGLGLVPRLALTAKRLRTVADFVNAPAASGIRDETAKEWASSPAQAPLRERSVQAFFSAFRTLGNHAFPAETIELTELLPNQGQDKANLLALDPVLADFDTYALDFVPGSSCAAPAAGDSATAADCQACPAPFVVRGVTVGFVKKPEVLTYYAVRLSARPKLLFFPFGNITLSAYAAARPFGSRIGPPLTLQNPPEFVVAKTNPAFCDPSQSSQANGNPPSCTGLIPNVHVKDKGDGGWYQNQVLAAFYQPLVAANSASGEPVINFSTIQRGQHIASVPTPWEAGLYNIPHDPGEDVNGPEFERFFDSSGKLALWAPLLPPGQQGSSALQSLLQETVASLEKIAKTPGSGIDLETFKLQVSQEFDSYLQALQNGVPCSPNGPAPCTEAGETLNVAVFHNPFVERQDLQPSGSGAARTIALANKDLQLDPKDDLKKIRSSFVSTKDAAVSRRGRVGYSVKFVAFSSLRETQTAGGAAGTAASTSSDQPPKNVAFPDGAEDISRLRH